MFWKLGRCKKISLGHQIEKRPTTRISLRPKLLSIQRTNSTANDNSQSKQFPALFAFHRPFRRLFQCALLVSAALCILYAHCWSRSLSAFKVSSEEGASMVCRGVFLPMIILFGTSSDGSCHSSESCADERFIWNLWVCAIMGHLFYYAMHEFTGKHHKGYRPSSQSRQPIKKDVASSDDLVDVDVSKSSSSLDIDDDDNGNSEDHEEKGDATTHDRINTEKEKDQWISLPTSIKKFSKSKSERPNDTLPMVPWYNLMMFTSGFDILVSLHIFLGRFDARKMQVALLKEKAKEPARIDMNSTNSVDACDLMDSEEIFDFSQCNNDYHERNQKDDGFWFDFMSDCGDGFNSSFQVSRLLAQPVLNVTMTSSTSTRGETRLLPRGKLLVIGGDLAYPDPTPKSYEQRFFRTFEDAMPPPPLFR